MRPRCNWENSADDGLRLEDLSLVVVECLRFSQKTVRAFIKALYIPQLRIEPSQHAYQRLGKCPDEMFVGAWIPSK